MEQNKLDAVKLLEFFKSATGLKNDAAISRALGVAPSVVSKLRSGALKVGPTLILKMHDITGLSAKQLREIA